MLFVHGWCVLRTSREPFCEATFETVDAIDDVLDEADRALWADFRQYMSTNTFDDGKWQFVEYRNNLRGLLLCFESSNHRASYVWDMMQWIAQNGTGSYGLFYVRDDEDDVGIKSYGRGQQDFTNEFRVHRILNGEITELADPFLSPTKPRIDPPNDYA